MLPQQWDISQQQADGLLQEITPLTIGKFIKIKLGDTLKKNTTYSFNFGKSIVDNNEENNGNHGFFRD